MIFNKYSKVMSIKITFFFHKINLQTFKVISVKIVTKSRPGPGSKYHGYVTLSSADSLNKCIQVLNNTELDGRIIVVEKLRHDTHRTIASTSKPTSSSLGVKRKVEISKDNKDVGGVPKETTTTTNGDKKDLTSIDRSKSIQRPKEITDISKKPLQRSSSSHMPRSRPDAHSSSSSASKRHHESLTSRRDHPNERRSSPSAPHDKYRKTSLSFARIQEERARERSKRLQRDQDRKRLMEKSRIKSIEKKQRDEMDKLALERERLRIEREKLEREKIENEKLKLYNERLEQERIKQELKLQQEEELRKKRNLEMRSANVMIQSSTSLTSPRGLPNTNPSNGNFPPILHQNDDYYHNQASRSYIDNTSASSSNRYSNDRRIDHRSSGNNNRSAGDGNVSSSSSSHPSFGRKVERYDRQSDYDNNTHMSLNESNNNNNRRLNSDSRSRHSNNKINNNNSSSNSRNSYDNRPQNNNNLNGSGNRRRSPDNRLEPRDRYISYI